MRTAMTLNVTTICGIIGSANHRLSNRSMVMPSNAAPIVQQIQGDFHALLAYVTGPEAQTQSAYTVELTLFRRLLSIGAALLRLFFVAQAAERPPAPTTTDGAVWSYYDQRSISYYSIFGKLRVARHYFTASGHAGNCPLDAALSLPDHCYSDLLSDWASYGSTDAAYRENQAALERILGLTVSVQAALLHEARRADHPTRPLPVHKEARATLDGKASAVLTLQQRAAQRDGQHIRARLALTDGAESLQQHMLTAFPEHTLILDIIHASEYLWATATAVLGETSPLRTPWVALKLDLLLTGQVDTLIADLTAEAVRATWTETQRTAIARTIGYYVRNRAYMQYDRYLAQGWPIGTGVAEGACGHLVKDR